MVLPLFQPTSKCQNSRIWKRVSGAQNKSSIIIKANNVGIDAQDQQVVKFTNLYIYNQNLGTMTKNRP